MRIENITRFNELASSDATIQEKLRQIHADAARSTVEKIAALSAETGTPFTAEEFLASLTPRNELSEAELETVAGGVWSPSFLNIVGSTLSLGIGCALAAAISAAEKGHADACQLGT